MTTARVRRRPAALCGGCMLAASLATGCSAAAAGPSPESVAELQAQYEAEVPKTILELQPFRTEMRVPVSGANGSPGMAVLINLNPNIDSWYLLTIESADTGGQLAYHLDSPRPQRLSIRAQDPHGLLIESEGGWACEVWRSGAGSALEAAVGSQLPYAPICSGRLYVRNAVAGYGTPLERITDFLRDHVWGGEQVITIVKEQLYQDRYIEKDVSGAADSQLNAMAPPAGPQAARLASESAGRGIVPEHLRLDLAVARPQLQPGAWYPVRDLPGISFSVIAPERLPASVLAAPAPHVNALDATEVQALVYLVAFDLQQLDLHFVLGTDHPRLDWSPRPARSESESALPGPDGIGASAPLVRSGMVSPADAPRTVATFAGGFKRVHGAFHSGLFATRNHGSHYGFIEEGVIFSKLQPGLATLLVMDDGAVDARTWSAAGIADLAHIRYARQNGVPLIEYDPARGTGVPGSLVNLWGPGNWSGSAEEVLRTVRAGVCLQESGPHRYLIFGYFSAATPSAMARVFAGYDCHYAMQLDINALEHTYLALYAHRGRELLIEHLIEGMEAVDRSAHDKIAPRFLGYPDERDFFYLTRREGSEERPNR